VVVPPYENQVEKILKFTHAQHAAEKTC